MRRGFIGKMRDLAERAIYLLISHVKCSEQKKSTLKKATKLVQKQRTFFTFRHFYTHIGRGLPRVASVPHGARCRFDATNCESCVSFLSFACSFHVLACAAASLL